MRLGDAVEAIFSGRVLSRGGDGGKPVPVLGLKDIGVELAPRAGLETVSVANGFDAGRLSLHEGDVVVTSRTTKVRAAVAGPDHRGVLVGPNLIVVRPSELLSGQLIAAYLRHPSVQAELLSEFASKTPPGFSVGGLGRLEIAIPTYEHQSALAELVHAAEEHAASVQKAAELRLALAYGTVRVRLRGEPS